ncbi:DUF1329 domain-containing protein [Fontimonas sp. SYSU GA230001]|uniref:DUF1329 domain-containing protein n=1 Tax=Fontimonas sp. SYSU GA230001 TaxID=3142450 RepID=UPI0032B3D5DA
MRASRWLVLPLLACVGAAAARVTDDQAARLGGELTPLGAERAGNDEGSIPAWSGGLTVPPPCFGGAGARYCEPYPDDRPLFVITAANLTQHEHRLSPGQIALLRQFPDSYRMPVYATRRSFANPDFVYAATLQNATRAELKEEGLALLGAATGVPFPIPETGAEVIWNHRTRYRDQGVRRWNNQFAVNASGDYGQIKLREDVLYRYSQPGATPASLDNVLYYFLQVTLQPQRLAGSVLLIHETLDGVREARRVWQFNPGQRRLRRAPNVGYDNPGIGADALRTDDQSDGFNGPLDRYRWKLLGKRELIVPANSYRLHSDTLRYVDILRKNHIDQDLTRYELRRVWVVEAQLRPATPHVYRRRVFYVDEDGWQIRVVDLYDAREKLWRVQELHSVIAYDKPYELPVCETVYDLQHKRYLAQALNNEDPETVTLVRDVERFEPGAVSKFVRE